MRTVREIINQAIEPNEPADSILAFLKANDGKRVDKRLIDKIAAETGDETIRLDKAHGMTRIEWGGWRRYGGKEGGQLLLSHSDKNVVVDAAWVEEKNPAEFRARDERNAKRQQVTDEECSHLDEAIYLFKAARNKVRTMLAYEGKFEPDRHRILEEHKINWQALDDDR